MHNCFYLYLYLCNLLLHFNKSRSGFGTHGISIRYTYERIVTDRNPVGSDDSGRPKSLKQVFTVPLPNAQRWPTNVPGMATNIVAPTHIVADNSCRYSWHIYRPMCCKYRHQLLPTTIYVGRQYIIMTMSPGQRSKCDALHR